MNFYTALMELQDNIQAFLKECTSNDDVPSDYRDHAVWLSRLGVSIEEIRSTTLSSTEITKSVGLRGINQHADVELVQELLNEVLDSPIDVDGACGKQTIGAIKKYQREALHFSDPDGLINPGKITWRNLIKRHPLYKSESTTTIIRETEVEPIKITPREVESIAPTVPPKQQMFDLLKQQYRGYTPINAPVGKGGINDLEDVNIIQRLLKIEVTPGVSPIILQKLYKEIKKFQRVTMRIEPTGLIRLDDATWQRLHQENGILVPPKEFLEEVEYESTKDQLPSKTISAAVGKLTDSTGNVTADVLLVQRILRFKWGYKIPVDGVMTEEVIHAIRQFQYRYVGSTSNQDCRIDPGGNTWKYLVGIKKPLLEQTEDGILGGVETQLEKDMAEFTKLFTDMQIVIHTGETVSVRPPYHINIGHRLKKAMEARIEYPKVTAVISGLGYGSSYGKASPIQMKEFLEACIKKKLIPTSKQTSQGLHEFLAKFGVSTDCSGLAIQAANFLLQGDLKREGPKSEVVQVTNTEGIQKHPEVRSPDQLQAGDMMVNYRRKGTSTYHVRVIVDVDIDTSDDSVSFTTVESGSSRRLGAGGHGVGQQRWRFPKKNEFANLKKVEGNQWQHAGKSDQAYTYVRLNQMQALNNDTSRPGLSV